MQELIALYATFKLISTKNAKTLQKEQKNPLKSGWSLLHSSCEL